jgi:ribosomal protein S18 acetylase RimI-like enzyme
MSQPTIRPSRADEYDAVADVWMRSWLSNGIADPHGGESWPLAEMRERIPQEIANGWSLYVADDAGTIAAMLAFRLRDGYLDQLFIAPEYQGKGLGKRLLACTRQHLPDEIWLRCVRENERAWRWYEREGFVFEKEERDPRSGFTLKYYRWKRTP